MRLQTSLTLIASLLIWPVVRGFAASESRYSLVHCYTNGEALYPSELCRSSKGGAVWGVTQEGGKAGGGVPFRFSAEGSDYTPVADLALSGRPQRLLQGSDGRVYILVRAWSYTNGVDAIVQVSPDGGTNTVVHAFASADEGRDPTDLLEGSDGWLYGSTAFGGSAGNPRWGTVFKLRPDGSGYQILRAFSIAPEEGGQVYGLMEGSDGALYGTCAGGGIAPGGNGTLFRLSNDGTGSEQPPDAPLYSGFLEQLARACG